MGKIFDKLMNTMRLNGDDYEEEYDAGYDDAEYDDGYDNYDSYDDYEEPAPAPKKKPTPVKEKIAKPAAAASAPSTRKSSKIVPMRSSQNIQEVRVVHPGNYDSAREIIDTLLDGQACIVNLEGISFDLAAQITDFIFGGCYALDGNIEKVNNFIFITTPTGLEITGDVQSITKKPADTNVSGYQMR